MKQILIAALVATSSAPAFAHAGAHDGFSGWETAAAHLLGSPFHVAVVLGAVAVAGAGYALYNRSVRRKATQRRG